MQTIHTKYVGPSNVRGSRIIATASGSKARIIVSCDLAASSEDAHIEGAKALCAKMDWHGTMIGGHTKDGMVFVFDDTHQSYRFTV